MGAGEATTEAGIWPDNPLVVTDATIDDVVRRYPIVIVDCWAPWCGPCRMLTPVIDELARQYSGKIVFCKLNVDENKDTPQRYEVMSIPTLLFFDHGRLVDKQIGALPKHDIVRTIGKKRDDS